MNAQIALFIALFGLANCWLKLREEATVSGDSISFNLEHDQPGEIYSATAIECRRSRTDKVCDDKVTKFEISEDKKYIEVKAEGLRPGVSYSFRVLGVICIIYTDPAVQNWNDTSLESINLEFCTTPQAPTEDLDWYEKGAVFGNVFIFPNEARAYHISLVPQTGSDSMNLTHIKGEQPAITGLTRGEKYQVQYARRCSTPNGEIELFSETVQSQSSFCVAPEEPKARLAEVTCVDNSTIQLSGLSKDSSVLDMVKIEVTPLCNNYAGWNKGSDLIFTTERNDVLIENLMEDCEYSIRYATVCETGRHSVESPVVVLNNIYCAAEMEEERYDWDYDMWVPDYSEVQEDEDYNYYYFDYDYNLEDYEGDSMEDEEEDVETDDYEEVEEEEVEPVEGDDDVPEDTAESADS